MIQDVHRENPSHSPTLIYNYGFPKPIIQCDLREVNPNLLNLSSTSESIQKRPYYDSNQSIPLTWYKEGFIQLPLTESVTEGNFTFSYETSPKAAEPESDTFALSSVGGITHSPVVEEETIYVYSSSDYYPLVLTKGNIKVSGYIEITPNMTTPILGVLIACPNTRLMGGFKMEAGEVATPVNAEALAQADNFDFDSVDTILGDTSGVRLDQGCILQQTYGFPSELGVALDMNLSTITDLTSPVTFTSRDYKSAILYGVAVHMDTIDFDTAPTQGSQFRMRRYDYYLNRVKTSKVRYIYGFDYGVRL